MRSLVPSRVVVCVDARRGGEKTRCEERQRWKETIKIIGLMQSQYVGIPKVFFL